MDTQPNEAVANDANAPVDATDPTAFFEQMAAEEFNIADEEEQAPVEGEDPESAEDEPQIEEEADDLPPIDAPVSLTPEEKEAFKNLPREAQEFTARRIGELEKGFNQKAQEAAQAKQTALSQATAELAQIDEAYAQRYQQMAEQVLPARPNPALLQHDPQAFYAQQYAYEAAVAQQQQLQQLASQHTEQARAQRAQVAQAEEAEQRRIIVEQFPEYADPTTGPELQRKLSAVAKRMGYSDELISQARAQDILAMRTVADAFDKADKYDALQKTKMAGVRAAKGLPKVAKPGTAQGNDQVRARNAQSALEVARSTKDRNVQGAAFFNYLKSTGQL